MALDKADLDSIQAMIAAAVSGSVSQTTAPQEASLSVSERNHELESSLKQSVKRDKISQLVNHVAIKQEMRPVVSEILQNRLSTTGTYGSYEVTGTIDGTIATAEKCLERWVSHDPSFLPFLSATKTKETVMPDGTVKREVSRIANCFAAGSVNLTAASQIMEQARSAGNYERIDDLLKEAARGPGIASAFKGIAQKRDSGIPL